jgi:acetate kinase
MNVLILNCGSSSLKFMVIESDLQKIAADSDRVLARGVYERIGGRCLVSLAADGRQAKLAMPLRDHRQAIDHLVRWLISDGSGIDGIQSLADLHAVGHRVVHGGERFKASVVIDDDVVKGIEDCIELAPLHNPANLSGIRAAKEIFGAGMPQVAVFDTAFHAAMPETAYVYAIPYQYYRRHKIRRYGFHGTSHRYIAYRYRQITNKPKDAVNIITLHLGNGCSACAIKGGQSVDTSMGMTPLEGLVMGTRSGDMDPAIFDYLAGKEGLSFDQMDALLNKQSGLLGLSGLTNDMRELLDEEATHQDRRAKLAIDVFCYRVRKYIGSYIAALGGADAVVFSGGIGENSPVIRERIVAGLEWMGLKLDSVANQATVGKEGLISAKDSRVQIYAIPTNEELLIARDTVRAMSSTHVPES